MTFLHDIVDPSDLQRGIDDGLIKVRESGKGDRIYNYTDAAMYTPGAWDNPAVRACRGLIVARDDSVIARPWAKFFNHNQTEAGSLDLDAPVEVTDKMDGSLGIVSVDEGLEWRVTTRGSFESEQAVHATQWLRSREVYLDPFLFSGITPLVEIIYPGNRIVCDYGALDELVLLGGVEIATGRYLGPAETVRRTDWRFSVTETFEYGTLREALAAPPRRGAEGLCVRFLNENRIVKIKQADYIALHKIVTGLSEKSIWESMCNDGTLEDMLASLPDELHDWTRTKWWELEDAIEDISAIAHVRYQDLMARLPDEFERGEFARLVHCWPDHHALLFQLLDGRDIRPAILKTLKPKGDTRARPSSEDIA